jgi:hypothetical protein
VDHWMEVTGEKGKGYEARKMDVGKKKYEHGMKRGNGTACGPSP